MAAILRRQADRLGLREASLGPLRRFEDAATGVVVAGQQPALFGGPLYTFYKAFSAIRYARELEAGSGRPFVPLFWIASDDHDFEEVRRVHVTDGGAELGALEYPRESAPEGVSVGRVRIGSEMEAILATLAQRLPATEYASRLIEALRDAYAPGRCWGEAFARFVGSLLVPMGALVFDASDVEAKRLALPVFEREIERAGQSARAAREAGARLVERGYHAQIARTGDELNLFWHAARREAVRRDGEATLHLAESGRSLSTEQLLALTREQPENVSPGVLLRPIVQDHLLPTAAYVGGPSEVAYWAQVNALYPLFDMAPPAVVPRGGATLLEPKVEKVIRRHGLAWGALAGDVEPVIGQVLRARLPGDLPAVFERERAEWIESFGRLKAAVLPVDPSLTAALDTATGRMLHEGAVLERKLMQVWKRRHEETVLQIRRAAGQLFPHGGLQERTASVVGFAARYGPDLLGRLASAVGAPGSHVLVPLGGSDP